MNQPEHPKRQRVERQEVYTVGTPELMFEGSVTNDDIARSPRLQNKIQLREIKRDTCKRDLTQNANLVPRTFTQARVKVLGTRCAKCRLLSNRPQVSVGYLTIILRARVGYEMIDSQRGA